MTNADDETRERSDSVDAGGGGGGDGDGEEFISADAARHEFVRKAVAALDSNSMKQPDMAWKVDGKMMWDYCGVYARLSPYFEALMKHEPRQEVDGTSLLVVNTSKAEYIKDPRILRGLRVYCHTGSVVYGRRDSPSTLLRRFMCFEMYGLPEAAEVMRLALRARLDAGSFVGLCDAVSSTSSSVLGDLEDFARAKGVEVLTRAPPSHCARCSEATLAFIARVTADDDFNCSEFELMDALYGLCLKRCKGDVTGASQLLLAELNPPSDPPTGRKRRRRERASMWDSVRVSGLTPASVVSFSESHPGAFDDGFLMSLVRKCLLPPSGEEVARCKRGATGASSWPRHVPAPPNPGESYWWRCETEPGVPGVRFIAFLYRKGAASSAPAFSSDHGRSVCVTLTFGGVHVTVAVEVDGGSVIPDDAGGVSVLLEVANSRHDRWRRESVRLEKGAWKEERRLIGSATLAESGYILQQEGGDPYVLLKVCVEEECA